MLVAQVLNPNEVAVEISGYSLAGPVQFSFRPGRRRCGELWLRSIASWQGCMHVCGGGRLAPATATPPASP